MSPAPRVALFAIVSIALPLQAQTPAPQATFRGGTDLVQVDVSVLDNKRRPVRGLKAEDFTIFEDGQPREIQAFTEVNLPDRVQIRDASWTREVPSDVVTNQAGQEEGRLVIILLDRTIPAGEPTITAKRIATAAISQLGPGDLGAVVSTSNGAVQNLTSNRERLLRAITASDLSTDISDEAKEIEASVFALTGRTWSTLNDGRCQCGLCVLETITRVADAVQGSERRRKVLLFIGSDLLVQTADPMGNPSNDVGCGNRIKDARAVMFAAVDRANLTIHSLDPSGLVNVTPSSRGSSTLRLPSGPVGAATVGSSTADNLRRQGNLEVLPDRTGGRTVVNTNGPDLSVPEIFHESDSYYLIGFRPIDTSANGKFHQITVKTTRRGLDVRARSGYTAVRAVPTTSVTTGSIAEPVRDALTGLLPAGLTAIDLNAVAVAIPGTQRAAIALTVGVNAFAAQTPAATGTSRGRPLEIVATAFDPGGRLKGMARQTLELSWPSSATGEHRFDALSRIDLAPGEYELRVAVSGEGRTASVFSYVTVPAFAVAPLSLSNIVVAAPAGTLTAPKDFLSPVLPIVPSGQREFDRTGRFAAFLRIYQGTDRKDPIVPVQLQSTLVDAGDRIVATETRTLDAGQFAQGRAADYYVVFPLTTLPRGDYLLKVEAKMGPRAAGRAMRFVVKP
jgi:VWFA-related protein